LATLASSSWSRWVVDPQRRKQGESIGAILMVAAGVIVTIVG